MKLNKTLIIAGLIAGGMLVANVAVRAQGTTNATPAAGARPPGARSAAGFDHIAVQLALTDEQKAKARPVFDDARQKMAALRKDTTLDRTEQQAKRKEIQDEMAAKLKDIFTPQQFDQWQKMNTRRRPTGAPGTPPAPSTSTPPPAGGSSAQQ